MGPDWDKKFAILNAFRQVFSKLRCSEYAEENGYLQSIKIDGKPINLRKTKFHHLTADFSFDSDLRLRSDSLIKEFLETILQDFEKNDDFQTFKYLYDDLGDTINDLIDDCLTEKLVVRMTEMSVSQLIKLVEPSIVMNDFQIHGFELDMSSNMTLQYEMLQTVASANPDLLYVVIVDGRHCSNGIMNSFKQNQSSNLMLVVLVDECACNTLCDAMWFGKSVVDFANENSIYNDVTLNLPFLKDMDETRRLIHECLQGIENSETAQLKQIL